MEERELKGGSFSSFSDEHKFAGVKIKLMFQRYKRKSHRGKMSVKVSDSTMYAEQILTTPQSSSKVQSATVPHVFCSVTSLPRTVRVRGPAAAPSSRERWRTIPCMGSISVFSPPSISGASRANTQSRQNAKLGYLLNEKLPPVRILFVWT